MNFVQCWWPLDDTSHKIIFCPEWSWPVPGCRLLTTPLALSTCTAVGCLRVCRDFFLSWSMILEFIWKRNNRLAKAPYFSIPYFLYQSEFFIKPSYQATPSSRAARPRSTDFISFWINFVSPKTSISPRFHARYDTVLALSCLSCLIVSRLTQSHTKYSL